MQNTSEAVPQRTKRLAVQFHIEGDDLFAIYTDPQTADSLRPFGEVRKMDGDLYHLRADMRQDIPEVEEYLEALSEEPYATPWPEPIAHTTATGKDGWWPPLVNILLGIFLGAMGYHVFLQIAGVVR